MPRILTPFATVGQIAERLDRPLHRVLYVIAAREIAPFGRAGNSRLFDEDAIRRIDKELKRIDSAKGIQR